MTNLNSVLQRQLKKLFGAIENIPEDLHAVLRVVSETYDHQDRDRRMLERSIELSSSEMKQLNALLRKESEENSKALFEKLKESLVLLDDENEDLKYSGSDYLKLSHIAESLKKETLKRKIAEEERNLTQQKLIYANRIYRFISEINQMIVHVDNEEELYREACRIAIECGKFKAGWIGLGNEPYKKTTVAQSCGISQEDLSLLTNMTGAPQRHVLRTGTFYVCNNIGNDPALDSGKLRASDSGFCACMILPVRKSGVIVGVFNLYAAEKNFFRHTEIQLLKEATNNISFALDIFEKDSQRILSEQGIKRSEFRLNQAQSIAHFGSWSVNFSTGVALWSEEALRIYGFNPNENKQTYESWISSIHPEDLDYVLKVSKESELTLSNSSFFHRIIRKDGAIRHLYSQSNFELDDYGKPVGLYGVTHDVTEIKEAELALQESESNLQAIFQNTADGFILTDLKGNVKTFNIKAKEIIRLNTNQEINIGDGIYDFVHPSRKDNYKNAISKVLGGEVLRYEYPYTRKNGAVKWFDFTINPVYEMGATTGVSITSSDITERKLSEVSLIESEKRYSDLFQLSPLPNWVYDMKTLRFLEVNQAAIDNYGYTREEFLSMTIKDVRPPEDIPLLEKTLIKNKDLQSPAHHQIFRHQKKNGEKIQVEIQSNNIQYKGKIGKVVVARDITERLNYIQAIEEQNAKLREISWMQSHVIRAPLARIMGLASLIRDTPDEMNKLIEYLLLSADELDEVIMNITDKAIVVETKKRVSGKDW